MAIIHNDKVSGPVIDAAKFNERQVSNEIISLSDIERQIVVKMEARNKLVAEKLDTMKAFNTQIKKLDMALAELWQDRESKQLRLGTNDN